MSIICEYGVYHQLDIHHIIKCNVINENCAFVRWCSVDQCIKNTDGYINCKVRSEEMSRKIIEQENIIESTPNGKLEEKFKLKEENCKVIWVKQNSFAVDFKGYGISFDLDVGKKVNEYIKIQYESEIGKSDFKAYPIYE